MNKTISETGKMNVDPTPTRRNLGVDLLRCVAMWMIACLHILNRGGVISAAGVAAGDSLWPLRFIVSCGVNIYALISGYVTVTGRFRPARVAEIWLQVLFWNLTIAGIGELIQPHIMDEYWIRYIFPLTQKCFWYFTAYVGVYAFSPLINRGILALNPKQCRALIWTMLGLFSLGSALGYANQGDPWSIGAGYSVLWLLALYVVGACVRHSGFGSGIAGWKLLLAAVTCVLAAILWRELVCSDTGGVPFWDKQREHLLSYTNPTLAAFSLLMLLLFSQIRPRGIGAAAVKAISPLTFGVYIIHVHHVVWTWIEKLYAPMGELAPPLLIPAVLAAGVGLLMACAALDRIRSLLFKLLKVRPRLDRVEARILNLLQS